MQWKVQRNLLNMILNQILKILHLDPSIDIHNKLNIDQIIERIKNMSIVGICKK